MHVAVIGAGAAGLVALRQLSAKPESFRVVAFEQTEHVGGTWVYSDEVAADECTQGFTSCLYKNLKTNLPKEIMAFPDFPFPSHLPSFMEHQDVRKYLEDYTDHFNLRHLIKFETMVERVHPTKVSSPDTKWEMTYRHVHPDCQEVAVTEVFDAVMVCNGHYAEATTPDIPGLEGFQGVTLHSQKYKEPSPYRNKNVVVLGAAASGQDISLEIATVAKQIFLSHRKEILESDLPDNIRQVPGIKRVLKTSVLFENDEEVEADMILFCTGYRYKFPFLSPECHVKTDDGRVSPMYKHLIHTEYPSLAILGLCKGSCPFPQFHCQATFVAAALEGSMKLPTNQQMNKSVQEDYEWRVRQGMPHRYAHQMREMQWEYNAELAKLAKFKPIPDVIRSIFEAVYERRCKDLTTYKRFNYEILSPDSFREVPTST